MIFLEKINDIGVVEYLCNTEEDLQNIIIQDIKPGSTAHIITPKKDYILDEDKTWVEYIKEKEPKKEEEETILYIEGESSEGLWFDLDSEYCIGFYPVYKVPRNLTELKTMIDEDCFQTSSAVIVFDDDKNSTICTIQINEFKEEIRDWGTCYTYTFTGEVLEQILQYKMVRFEALSKPM